MVDFVGDFATTYNASTAEQERIAKSKQAKAESEMRLKHDQYKYEQLQQGAGGQQSQTEAKLQKLQAEVEENAYNTFRNRSHQSIDYFFRTGDPKQLNNFLDDSKKSDYTRDFFEDVATFQPLNDDDLNSPILSNYLSEKMREELDGQDGEVDGVLDKDVVNKSFVKAITVDGKTQYLPMTMIAEATGYRRWADKEQLARLTSLSKLSKDNSKPSAIEKEVKYRKKVANEGDPQDKAILNEMDATELKPTAGQRELIGATTAAREFERLGGFKMTQDEIRNNRDVLAEVQKVKLANPISQEHEKQLVELSAIAVGAKDASELEAGDVGYVDDTLAKIANITSEVGPDGVSARSAYGAFVNVLRHTLFGSAQTDGEIAAFKVAYSHLGAGIVPVLTGLRQGMRQTLAKLKTIHKLNDPVIVHTYMGKSGAELDVAIDTLQKKIAFYGEVEDKLSALNKNLDPIDRAQGIGADAVNYVTGADKEDARFIQVNEDKLKGIDNILKAAREKVGLTLSDKGRLKNKVTYSKEDADSAVKTIFGTQ